MSPAGRVMGQPASMRSLQDVVCLAPSSDATLPCFSIAWRQKQTVDKVINQFRKMNQIPIKPKDPILSREPTSITIPNKELISPSTKSHAGDTNIISTQIKAPQAQTQEPKEELKKPIESSIYSSKMSSKLSTFNNITSTKPSQNPFSRQE